MGGSVPNHICAGIVAAREARTHAVTGPKLIAQRAKRVDRVAALNYFLCVCNDVGALFADFQHFYDGF